MFLKTLKRKFKKKFFQIWTNKLILENFKDKLELKVPQNSEKIEKIENI